MSRTRGTRWGRAAAALGVAAALWAAGPVYAAGDGGPPPPPGQCAVSQSVVACTMPEGLAQLDRMPAQRLAGGWIRLPQVVAETVGARQSTQPLVAPAGWRLDVPWVLTTTSSLTLLGCPVNQAGPPCTPTGSAWRTTWRWAAGPGLVTAYTPPVGAPGLLGPMGASGLTTTWVAAAVVPDPAPAAVTVGRPSPQGRGRPCGCASPQTRDPVGLVVQARGVYAANAPADAAFAAPGGPGGAFPGVAVRLAAARLTC